MTDLTEKLEKGELETGREYWVQLTDEWKNSIEQVYFNGENFESFDIDDVEEILAPVPSYEEWQKLQDKLAEHKEMCCCTNNEVLRLKLMPFEDAYFNGLTTKEIAELAKKSIRLTKQHCEDNAEIEKLKELLQKCKVAFKIYANEDETCGLEEENKYAKHLLTKIDEVLK